MPATLKLQCIPPTVNYDQDLSQQSQPVGPSETDFDASSGSGEADFEQHMQVNLDGGNDISPGLPTDETYGGMGNFSSCTYDSHLVDQQQAPSNLTYSSLHDPSGPVPDPAYHHDAVFSTQVQPAPPTTNESPESWHSEQGSTTNLSEVLGELKIDETGAPPYMTHRKNGLVDTPVVDDADEFLKHLPPIASGPVRIPSEIMPSEDLAMHYFSRYFADIHPYVPVINREEFYCQWSTDRESISPLLLESIFCCAARISDDPSQSDKWLALAGKHADYFMDNPRLSTLQAMLILLKARECSPKRGYYYRSWMSVVNMVAMAKDLGLDEHYELHQTGENCESTPMGCIVKTRVWQTLFVCELMIGGPQGRSDMAVNPETVDFSVPHQALGQDDVEFLISRNFIFFTRIIRNVRRMVDIYGRIRRKKDWMADPKFVNLNPSFIAWLSDLPSDLQVVFPRDGTAPWVPSHFVANLHSYYYLSIIMLYRPQLANADYHTVDGTWKRHMAFCYDSAKKLCKLQEAILLTFGLSGLMSMQRGLSFAIYCVLTCLELHLAAVTSPYPEINKDAREYLTRHMRILERCTSSWSVPGMSESIQALREAFSADTSKPFVLKHSFPYNSPPTASQRSPPRNVHYHQHQDQLSSTKVPQQMEHRMHPLSPPQSAASIDTQPSNDPFAAESFMATTTSHAQQPQQRVGNTAPMGGQLTWNPTKIFDQWNTAFGTPQGNAVPTQTPLNLSSSPSQAMSQMQDGGHNHVHRGLSNTSPHAAPYNVAPPEPTFVTPNMWRESVTAVYEDGLKRNYGYGENDLVDQLSKRAR
ncbi:MAG: hypothetical protein M1837_007304 [Sclerophora amabilis]|nr:MAG: hypothetical protein M1837_007304 [Sclerophora amabilis]